MKTRPGVVLLNVVKMEGEDMTRHCVISHKTSDIHQFRENAPTI